MRDFMIVAGTTVCSGLVVAGIYAGLRVWIG